MVKAYRSAQWHAFREEVLRLDDYACTQCGRTREDGVRLHVHHKHYLIGHQPWEYPHDSCEALCSGCHAAEHGLIFPKYGWDFFGYEDLGDLSGECELCGQHIRHSFMVAHEKWGAREVGEMCCDNLTSTQVATGHLESVRKHRDRRKRFVSSIRWNRSARNVWEIWQKGVFVKVEKLEDGYRLRIHEQLGRKEFQTEVDAKAEAFDLIELGVIEKWAKRRWPRRTPI